MYSFRRCWTWGSHSSDYDEYHFLECTV
jgi:hypothetical protein